ncbi:MAG: NADPH:quinone reductase [Elusimicrobia bacterium]|nr:NADPH:quinone reductase [Elusimicrobiota bacterium]
MKAIRVREFGGPEVLRLEEVPVPAPGAGQVLVRVRAAGVNPYETYIRSGAYALLPALPYTPGSDGAGLVEAVGAGVERAKPGDRVYIAKCLSGTYAQYALALEEQVHLLPAGLGFQQGAGIWVPYGTAWHALVHFARARAGETVLVHGASGGVGLAGVQIARSMGLTVFGTAGTAKGLELAAREGASRVFDHGKPGHAGEIMEATGGRGVDIVLEMLANVNLAADTRMLAQNGRVIVIGSRGQVTIDPRELMVRRGSIRAFTLWGITPEEEKEVHAGVGSGLLDGALRPVVGREYPLAEAARAQKEIMEPGAYGKIVLLPPET